MSKKRCELHKLNAAMFTLVSPGVTGVEAAPNFVLHAFNAAFWSAKEFVPPNWYVHVLRSAGSVHSATARLQLSACVHRRLVVASIERRRNTRLSKGDEEDIVPRRLWGESDLKRKKKKKKSNNKGKKKPQKMIFFKWTK